MKIGMDFSAQQALGQYQTQKLTLRQIQAMKILQMPNQQLQERIETELVENPLLELRDPVGEERNNEPIEMEPRPDEPLKHDLKDANAEAEFQRLDEINRDWDGVFDEEHRPSRSLREEMGDRKLDAMQNAPDRLPCLLDHLLEQVTDLEILDVQRPAIIYLIENLDERGFLTADLPELVRLSEGRFALAELEDALILLQQMDPAGIGARDFKECLLLQIPKDSPHRDLLQAIILSHLEDVAHNRLPLIEKHLKCSREDLQEALAELRRFDPNPASRFAPNQNEYIKPDLYVEMDANGEYQVYSADDWSNRLYIPAHYHKMVKDREVPKETRNYLRERYQSAMWLKYAVEQRKATLEKVARAIVKHQREFLDKGPEYIAPLKMQDIAEEVNVVVSTISRAIKDKWIVTPRGTFPLKRFFVSAATNESTGEQVAWERIKQALLEMIRNEDKNKPLSDEELEKKLQAAGYPVKRRTVTKYRKLLNIPSSRERKQWS